MQLWKRQWAADSAFGLNESYYQRQARQQRKREKKAEEAEKSVGADRTYHSGFYHRMFEGYREELVLSGKGSRKKIVRIYEGNYYKRRCGDCQWHLLKAGYLLLFLACVAVYLFALTRPVACNSAWYVALPGLLSVVPMLLLFSKLLACMAAKREMVIYDYRYVFGRVFPFCLVAGIMLDLTALTMGVSFILNAPEAVWKELTPCLCCLLSGIGILSIGVAERNAVYDIVEVPSQSNETKSH